MVTVIGGMAAASLPPEPSVAPGYPYVTLCITIASSGMAFGPRTDVRRFLRLLCLRAEARRVSELSRCAIFLMDAYPWEVRKTALKMDASEPPNEFVVERSTEKAPISMCPLMAERPA